MESSFIKNNFTDCNCYLENEREMLYCRADDDDIVLELGNEYDVEEEDCEFLPDGAYNRDCASYIICLWVVWMI